MSNVVLVVDMLRGFLEEGYPLYCGDDARAIIPRTRAVIERELAAGGSAIFIADNHDPDDLEFKTFPAHCIRGSVESEIVPELADIVETYMPKRRYSAFFDTDLDERLKILEPEKVIIIGVCTDICVMHTASDARNRDYTVEVPVDCVASFDETAHNNALEHMKSILGVTLIASQMASESATPGTGVSG